MLEEILKKQNTQSDKSIEAFKKDYGSLRTGKVNIAILDNIMVDYYDVPTPLNQVASVLATDASTICINPWEKTMLKPIETAIMQANIGVNPNADADGIKLFFPPMTKEQREQNVKLLKGMAEKAKVAIRNIRKDANDSIKRLEKDKELSEDEAKKAHDSVQKCTDEYVGKIDVLCKDKEAALLKV